MVISVQCSGQMCNRILFFLQTLATALDCRRSLFVVFGGDVLRFTAFDPSALPATTRVVALPWRRSKIVDGVHGLLQRFPWWGRRYYERNARQAKRLAARPRFLPILLWNWLFRNDDAVMRHRAEIVSFMRVRDEFLVHPARVLAAARQDADLVVGVHFRRGDYRDVESGDWFFSDDEYLRFMREFAASVPGKRVSFVGVSNEPLDAAHFTRAGIRFLAASARPEEDLVTLSRCDYILGPPSSIAWWASYYGNVPRMAVPNHATSVDIAKFKLMTAATVKL